MASRTHAVRCGNPDHTHERIAAIGVIALPNCIVKCPFCIYQPKNPENYGRGAVIRKHIEHVHIRKNGQGHLPLLEKVQAGILGSGTSAYNAILISSDTEQSPPVSPAVSDKPGSIETTSQIYETPQETALLSNLSFDFQYLRDSPDPLNLPNESSEPETYMDTEQPQIPKLSSAFPALNVSNVESQSRSRIAEEQGAKRAGLDPRDIVKTLNNITKHQKPSGIVESKKTSEAQVKPLVDRSVPKKPKSRSKCASCELAGKRCGPTSKNYECLYRNGR